MVDSVYSPRATSRRGGSSFIVALAFAVSMLAAREAQAAKSQQVVSFSEQRSIASTLWIPEKIATIRGVLVITGGQGENDRSGDTRSMTDSRFYQRFAESIGFAILGNQFSGSYTEAASGPGQALLDSLSQHAMVTGHPELAHAPLLLEGFSNGGYFSFTFAKWMPKRVIAFALNKSGFARAQIDPEFAAVPGLFFWGEEELSKGLPTVIHSIVAQGRAAHALWAELKEWGRGHEEGDVERMIVPFFSDVVALRLPAKKTAAPSYDVALSPLYEEAGWLGDHSDDSIQSPSPTIASFAAYGGDKTEASWLPNEGLAMLWRGFVTKQPLEIDLPVSHAQLSAAQALQLMASGLSSGELVSFYDGATEIAKSLPANSGGEVRAQWMPQWGGGRGIVAVVKVGGVVTQTSRPSVVALYGKPPPKLAPQKKPPVPKTPPLPPQAQGAQGGPAPTPPPAAVAASSNAPAPASPPAAAATSSKAQAPSAGAPAATSSKAQAPSPAAPAATSSKAQAPSAARPAATSSKASPLGAAPAPSNGAAAAPPAAAPKTPASAAATVVAPVPRGPTPTPPPAATASPVPTQKPAATAVHKFAPAPPPVAPTP